MTKISINPLRACLSVGLGILIGWGFYELANPQSNLVVIALVTGLMASVLLTGLFGLKNDRRQIASVSAASSLILIIALIVDAIFACFKFNIPLFIITNGVLLISWLLIVSSVVSTSDARRKTNKDNLPTQ